MPSERLSELELSLLEQNAFTLFVSEWSGAHPGALEKLASSSLAPASLVDDRVYAEFEKFIVDRGLVGKTRFDTALDELGQAFGESKLSSLQSSVQELKGRATKELLGNLVDEKPKIVKKLENALRSRIEPGSKRLMAMLQMDTTIARAVAIAKDSSQYTALLQPGITITSPSRGGPEVYKPQRPSSLAPVPTTPRCLSSCLFEFLTPCFPLFEGCCLGAGFGSKWLQDWARVRKGQHRGQKLGNI